MTLVIVQVYSAPKTSDTSLRTVQNTNFASWQEGRAKFVSRASNIMLTINHMFYTYLLGMHNICFRFPDAYAKACSRSKACISDILRSSKNYNRT